MLTALMSMVLLSCEKDYVSELPSMQFKDLTFEVGGSTTEISFGTQDLSNFSISTSNESWVRARIDVEHSRILVQVDPNNTYDERSATVTIQDFKDGVSKRSFKVTQEGMKGLIVEENEYVVPMAGGTFTVNLKKNVNFTVEIPTTATWITVQSTKAGTRGLEPATVTFNVAKNNTGNTRQAIIKIVGEGVNPELISVTQDFKAFFKVTEKEFTLDELGGELEIHVNTNINFDVYSIVDWIYSYDRIIVDEENFIQKLRVDPYRPDLSDRLSRGRQTTFTIGNSAYSDATATINVSQERTFYINEKNSIIDMLIGQRYGLSLINFNKKNYTWESDNKEVATVNEDGVISALSTGVANISVSSEDGKYSDYVMVNVEKPFDIKDYVSGSWSYRYAADTISQVRSTIANSSQKTIYLKSYALYNDSSIVESDPNYNQMAVAGGSRESSSYTPIKSSKNYWAEWVFYYDYKNYLLKINSSGEYTITEVATAATTRSGSRRKSRR